MMKLCFLSLLIEDVLAMGGVKALGAATLVGEDTQVTKASSTTREKAENGEPPEVSVQVETVEKETSTETSDDRVSCGGHDAPSCGACINAPGAPQGKEAASWCNGDCFVKLSGDDVSCVPIQNGFVSCGHHQAEECTTCTNEAVGGALFCNGVCEFNDAQNKCLNK